MAVTSKKDLASLIKFIGASLPDGTRFLLLIGEDDCTVSVCGDHLETDHKTGQLLCGIGQQLINGARVPESSFKVSVKQRDCC